MNRGRIEGLFIYPEKRAPAESREEVSVDIEQGFDGDRKRSKKRTMTLLSLDQWREVQKELGVDLPPQTRRSNVIVSGMDLRQTIGKKLRVGEVEVGITMEVDPCQRMDEMHSGLREKLVPEMRGGVGGRILRGGVIRIGDAVEVIEEKSQAPTGAW